MSSYGQLNTDPYNPRDDDSLMQQTIDNLKQQLSAPTHHIGSTVPTGNEQDPQV